MSKRARYQQGCLAKEKRKTGPDVWIYRYRDAGNKNRKEQVGTVEEFPTKAEALKEVEYLRVKINADTHAPRTMSELIAHYSLKELAEDSVKAYSTCHVYGSYIKTWIRPKWGECRIRDVKTVAVEAWLGSIDLAENSKAKIRNIMSAIFNHAIRWEFTDKNPITGPVKGSGVRQGAKRERIPEVLDIDELKALLSNLKEPHRTAAFVAAVTGLRVSELLALQWQDIHWDEMEIHLQRGIVHQQIGALKTEASQKPIPMDSGLCAVLTDWKAKTAYNQPQDWVFASPTKDGKQPFWPDSLMRRVIRPAAAEGGIAKHVGWHTFRRSYATLLNANGEDVKTVQESLRHANSKITLDIYTQGLMSVKRKAQGKVVQALQAAGNGLWIKEGGKR